MMKTARFVGLTLVLSLSGLVSGSGLEAAGTGSTGAAAESDIAAKAPLKAAIFVRNRGGKAMDSKIDLFSDQLSAHLSEKGFAVMDWKDVVQKFRESNETDENIFKTVKTVMAIGTDTGVTGSSIATTEKTTYSDLESSVGAQGPSGGVARASLLRVAQMLDADYIIVASIGKVGKETRKFKGEGTIYQTNNTADIYTLPMTVKVLDGSSGQSIYGDTLTASERILQNANIEISFDNMPDRLIDSGTLKLATNISDKVQRIRDTIVRAKPTVPFIVECNVVGATVELDGAAIGSPPDNFNAPPGIHQLTVSKEYFKPWERAVNITANQKITVSLEFTTEGLAKYKDITAFNQAQALQKLETVAKVDIAREQSKADADVKEKVSSGVQTFLGNSYIRSNDFMSGLTTLVRGGDNTIAPIVPVQPPAPPIRK
jgi:hypothetical protein